MSKTLNLVRFRTLWTEVQRGHRTIEYQVCDSDPGSLSILQFPFPTPIDAARWCENAFGAWRMCCADSFEHLGDDSCMTAAHWGVCWAWTTCELRAEMCESSWLCTAFTHQSDSWIHCRHLGILPHPGDKVLAGCSSIPLEFACALSLHLTAVAYALVEIRQQWSWASSVECGPCEGRLRLFPSLSCLWCPGTVWFVKRTQTYVSLLVSSLLRVFVLTEVKYLKTIWNF